MILSTFTFVHVLISRIAIFAGLVVVYGLFTGKRLDGWTALFVWTTVATSVTGFLFPFPRFMPSHALGIISLVVLAVVTYARYGKHVAGSWRGVYTVTAVTALHLNVLVLIAQVFQKVPVLKALAPTQSEPPFLVTHVVALTVFAVLAIVPAVKFRAQPTAPVA